MAERRALVLRRRRDAALAPIGAAAADALAVLAAQLESGQITEDDFVAQAEDQLAMSYAQAMQAAAAAAAQDYGIVTGAEHTGLAVARAAAQAGLLAGLAGLITSGVTADQQAARVGFYAGTVTGAWESAYAGAITSMSPQATFVWTATGDDATCGFCADMDGAEFTADDLGGTNIPGDATDFGADTDGCEGGENCRCVLLPNDVAVMGDDSLAATGGPMNPDTLTADGVLDDEDETPDGTRVPPLQFHAYLVAEGVRTIDGRQMQPGSLTLGDLPLPWMYQPSSPHGGGPNDPAVVAGTIETAERLDSGVWYVTGTYADTDAGSQAADAAGDGSCRFVSVDVYGAEASVVVVSSFDPADGPSVDDDPDDTYLLVTKGEIRGGTQLPFPALPMCVVALRANDLPEPAMPAAPGLMAAGGPVSPPEAWFADPGFAAGDGRMVQDTRGNWACPLTTDSERVWGHIAAWSARHIGFAEAVRPPRSRAGYAYFRTGSIRTLEGTDVPVGQLTMGCGHCDDDYATAYKAKAHYDGGQGAVQFADVACGEDDYGIWVAGAVRPGVTDEQIREFRALAPSGDWRRIGGNLELVACVQVPVPGFPLPRSLAASADAGWPVAPHAALRDGEIMSLVAAGRVVADPHGSRFARLESEVADLRSLVASLSRERLAARVSATA